MSEQTYARLLNDGLAALRTHSGVVLDATFSRRANRNYLREECAKAHVRLQMIELDATESEIVRRLRARDQSTEEISDARLEDFAKLSAAYEPPDEFAGDLVSIATSDSVVETAKAVLVRLAEKHAS